MYLVCVNCLLSCCWCCWCRWCHWCRCHHKFGSFSLRQSPRYLYTWGTYPWAFSSPGWTLTAVSASPILQGTHSNISMSLLYEAAQHWTEDTDVSHLNWAQGKNCLLWSACNGLPNVARWCWHSLLQGRIAHSWSAYCPPRPQGPSLQSCTPAISV